MPLDQLRATLNRINPSAPQFTVETRLIHFVQQQGKIPISPAEMRACRALAFCGLGNPDNLFNFLTMNEITAVARKTFPDHHRYCADDLRLLEELVRESRANCLITTEKDLVNLPEGASFSVPLYWAAIELAVDEEARLLAWLRERLGFPVEGASSGSPSAGPIRERRVAAIL